MLGSRQAIDVLDADACRRRDVEIVRRRSGGGVVLLVPGATEWIDVVVPAGDDQWDDDVVRSMVRLGERWVDALRDVVDGELTVHRGPMVRTRWSELACFAGIAPGEVLLDGVKLVGLSQRRTRRAARFQCAVNRRFDDAPADRAARRPAVDPATRQSHCCPPPPPASPSGCWPPSTGSSPPEPLVCVTAAGELRRCR